MENRSLNSDAPIWRQAASAGASNYVDPAVWRMLEDAQDFEKTCASWLHLQCCTIQEVCMGVVVVKSPDQSLYEPVAFWPQRMPECEHLTRVTENVLKERKGVVVKSAYGQESNAADSRYQIAYPIQVSEQLYGAAALEITSRPQSEIVIAMRQLQWGIAWLKYHLLRLEARKTGSEQSRLASAFHLTASVLLEPTIQSAAMTLATQLAAQIHCDRVSVGFLKGRQIKVLALSHSAQFGKQMNLIRSIGAAMDECYDQKTLLRYPRPSQEDHWILRAHEELASHHHDGAICTIPFLDAKSACYGALTLERATHEPFDDKTVEYCESVVALAAPILEEKRQNDRWLVTKAAESFRRQLEHVAGRGHVYKKTAAFLLLAMVVFFSVKTGEYHVSADAAIEGAIQRAIVSPYRGYIREASARAGDIVEAGQTLCHLDDRDTILEHLGWVSRKEQYNRQLQKAMAEGDRAAVKVLQEQVNQAEAQINLLSEQISRAKITAPFHGIIVKGDLSQSLGAPVERGDILFEMAPLDAYRVILKVDEREVRNVQVGQEGKLLLNALPGEPFPFSIEKITPVSTAEEGKNCFRVEAKLGDISEQLRPGMEGFGRIFIDRRKLIWIWSHDIIDWMKIWIWSWRP
ncbi:MAG: efflux RND transporter periplasmic adaptor subunit [Candidatus Hinthialibacter sp.]